MFNQKLEEIQNLKISKNKIESELNLAKLDIRQKGENIKQLEEKFSIMKNEGINNKKSINIKSSSENNVNKELMNIMEQNTQLIKEKNNLQKEISILKDNNMLITEENKNYQKENTSLQDKINKLSEENITLNDIYNKYHELKKIIIEKDKEILESKEINKALIEKQKNIVEQESNISPKNHQIITSKKYKDLIWYLVFNNGNENNKNKNDDNNYKNFKWITGLIITKEKLEKFNKFETDDQKLKDKEDQIFSLLKKIERKEESLSIMDYKNKKLIEQNHNKTANIKGIMKNNFIGEASKNQQIANSAINEISILKNEVSKLKDEIKARDKFEAGMPKNINIIEQDNNSGFLDEDSKDNKTGGMFDFIKTNNYIDILDDGNSKRSGMPGISIKSQISSNTDFKMSERKVDDFLNRGFNEINDYDIEKQTEEQMKVLKSEIKEKNNKFEMLKEQFEELMKNIKCDLKNKPQIVQICQIFGKSPDEINKIVNKKKSIF